jgi:hypothetical protein
MEYTLGAMKIPLVILCSNFNCPKALPTCLLSKPLSVTISAFSFSNLDFSPKYFYSLILFAQ